MRDGICPKCDSREIFTDANFEGKGNNYGLNKVVAKTSLLGNILVEYDNLYCANCGYLEHYIVRKDDREKILENWTRFGKR